MSKPTSLIFQLILLLFFILFTKQTTSEYFSVLLANPCQKFYHLFMLCDTDY